MNLGFGELLVILIIVLVLFGAGRLPQLGKGLGEAIRGFKDAMSGEEQKPESKPESKKELPPDAGPKK